MGRPDESPNAELHNEDALTLGRDPNFMGSGKTGALFNRLLTSIKNNTPSPVMDFFRP